MNLIPATIRPSTRSAAERYVFKSLLSLDVPGFAIHSLNLPDHHYKLVGEADFVIVSTRGVLVLEVKGGRVGYNAANGRFATTDRNGLEHVLLESPYQQAYSAMWAVRDILAARLGDAVVDTISFGSAVALPETEWRRAFRGPGAPLAPPDFPDEALVDLDDFRRSGALARAISRAQGYWRDKKPHTVDLDSARIAEIRRALRSSFDVAPALTWEVERLEVDYVAFTDDQYEKLDAAEENDRLLITGGAGTGKTFLALETAKNHARHGDRVALVVSSPVMREFLKAQLDADKVEVLTLDSSVDVPPLSWDMLVLDEAQDAMNLGDLEQLDSRLDQGLERGRWRVFLDPNSQAGLLGTFEPDAYEWVRSMGYVMRLKDNCRNTEEIVRQTQIYTGADVGVPGAGRGFPVVWASVDSVEESTNALLSWIDSLLAQGAQRRDFAFVSPVSWAESAVAGLPRRWTSSVDVLDCGSPARDLTKAVFASPADFKGLESRYVALVDYGEDEISALTPLYVGMTRAKAMLWMCVSQRMREKLAQNAARVLGLEERGPEGGQH